MFWSSCIYIHPELKGRGWKEQNISVNPTKTFAIRITNFKVYIYIKKRQTSAVAGGEWRSRRRGHQWGKEKEGRVAQLLRRCLWRIRATSSSSQASISKLLHSTLKLSSKTLQTLLSIGTLSLSLSFFNIIYFSFT